MRHSVEHLACSGDVAVFSVEDDELGAHVQVRGSGGRDDLVVDGPASPEAAHAALEEGVVEGGVGGCRRAPDEAHCRARMRRAESTVDPLGWPVNGDGAGMARKGAAA